jgi:hypothetical protein
MVTRVFTSAKAYLWKACAMSKLFNNIVYVSYFTVEPKAEQLPEFLKRFDQEVMGSDSEFWVLGQMAALIQNPPSAAIRTFPTITDLVKNYKISETQYICLTFFYIC